MSVSDSRSVTVENEQGLHLRPAGLFAETASKFESQIEIVKDDLRIDGKSALSILTLGAAKGTQLEINATGPDANEAINVLSELLGTGFPEEDISEDLPQGPG